MWTAEAPANIALIKYMGKNSEGLPCNSSLSYTIDRFYTKVSLELSAEDEFENKQGFSQVGVNKFLNHLRYIKGIFGSKKHFLIKSENNFPHSSGVASSASSFAALTLCSIKAICEIQAISMPSLEEMSAISRKGSGSSCRSFFAPWALWEGESAKAIDLPDLDHDLILVDSSVKKISSSEAHKYVKTSPLFAGRPQRAEARLEKLISFLRQDRWYETYQLCKEEFLDMHALFETSSPSFSYMTENTITLLHKVEEFWNRYQNGPIVTIDAGPNIHLLWRKNYQQDFKNNSRLLFLKFLKTNCRINNNTYAIL